MLNVLRVGAQTVRKNQGRRRQQNWRMISQACFRNVHNWTNLTDRSLELLEGFDLSLGLRCDLLEFLYLLRLEFP